MKYAQTQTAQTGSKELTALANRMKKGDRKAAEKLYEELFPKVYGFFFSRTGKKEIAEDLSQNIFIKLIEKIKIYDTKKGSFTVWFWHMARNMLIDYYRSKKEHPFSNFEDDTVEAFMVMETPDFEQRLQYNKVKGFMGTLASHERQLFELRYIADMPFKEISVIMAKSEASLSVAAYRIRNKIQKEFENATY